MVDFDRNEGVSEYRVGRDFMDYHNRILEKNKKYKEGLLKLNEILNDEIKIKAIVDKVYKLYEEDSIEYLEKAVERGIREYIQEIKGIFEDIYVVGCDKI